MLECIKDSNGRPVYYINGKRVNKITALAYAKSNNKKLPTFMRKGFRETDKIENKKVKQKNPNKLLEEIEILKKQIKQYQDENESLKKESENLKNKLFILEQISRNPDLGSGNQSHEPERLIQDQVVLNSIEDTRSSEETKLQKPDDWNNTQKTIFEIENKLLNKLESFIKDKNDIINTLEELNFNNRSEEEISSSVLNETEIEDFENIIYKIENNIKEAKYILKKISKIKRTFELPIEETGFGNFNDPYINNIINKGLKFLKNIK